MTEEKRNIDLLFKQGLKGFRAKPPVHAWERLEHDLDRASRSKRLFYFRLAAASVLIILAFGAGYFYATYHSEEKPVMVDNGKENFQIDHQQAVPQTKEENIIPEKTVAKQTEKAAKDQVHPVKQKNLPQIVINNNNDNFTALTKQNTEVAVSDKKPSEIKIDTPFSIAQIPVKKTDFSNPEIIQEIGQKSVTNENIAINESNPYNPFNESDYEPLSKNKNSSKWSLGAQLAPVVSYRDISTNYTGTQHNGTTDTESQLNHSEDALLSYAGGLDLSYGMSNRLSIQSGLYFSRIGQVNNDALNFKQEQGEYLLYAIRTSTGNINVAYEKVPDNIKKFDSPKDTITSPNLNNVKVIQNIDLFEVPFMIRYKIINKKLSISLAGGLTPSYLLRNNTYLQVNSDKYSIGSASNLNNIIFNSTLGMGIEYLISKKFSVDLEPVFKYSLNPMNKDGDFSYHPYYFSCFTGLRYKF